RSPCHGRISAIRRSPRWYASPPASALCYLRTTVGAQGGGFGVGLDPWGPVWRGPRGPSRAVSAASPAARSCVLGLGGFLPAGFTVGCPPPVGEVHGCVFLRGRLVLGSSRGLGFLLGWAAVVDPACTEQFP